ncbi:RlpA-like double-psi beta-barrel-protein domain-containing protein-containing protein [Mycena olivaceomarginata]|nr:RlpA-like double-psi beta-barrel-protein domain-containing protein-containing protein [Mycena olivaceomarginata]
MSRASVLLVLFFCIALAFASPVQRGNATVEALDKRITHVGRGTWYNPSVGEGNCGYWDSDSSPVVAISKARYDANGGENCNQWIQITNTANGKTAFGKTRDSCESCDTSSLDMSPGLFKEISTLATGEITISWHFMAAGWHP